jgi:hypothetical protein
MACDIQCQKNKQLSTLLTNLHEATTRKGVDPEAYEQARIAYYTLKEGNTWLQAEKEKIARQKIDPIINQYKTRYAELQARKDTKDTEVGDEDEARFIHAQIQEEQNRAGVHKRLRELGPVSQSWFPLFLDVLIGILILLIVYLAITKFSAIQSRITSYFTPTT